MTAWRCRACTALYSVDAPRCPQCAATDPVEDGAVAPEPVRNARVRAGHASGSGTAKATA